MTDPDPLASLEARWREKAEADFATMKRLAKEATNGWACYARTKLDHADIARLHREIDDLAALRIASHEGHETTTPRHAAED